MKTLKIILGILSISLLPLIYGNCSFIQTEKPYSININGLRSKAKEALVFCKEKKLETKYCFLIDMSIHSGRERFFVWDFTKDTIIEMGMVSHGCGTNPWASDFSKSAPLFSNTPESHLSSLGKYKIGARGYSQWGINVNYKMHGLESTNSKAYERYIVLHSWEMIPNKTIYPAGTPEGWGCPAVSNEFMKRLDERLKNKSKDVLLWIYKD
jgi:hypothetical protein